MANYRVGVLMHEDLVPSKVEHRPMESNEPLWRTEFDILKVLKDLGHVTEVFSVNSETSELAEHIERFRPDIVFNLLEEFDDRTDFDHHIVSFLELMGVPYTGTNPRGLMLARDKALSKKILMHHGIRTPNFFVVGKGANVKKPTDMSFPLIVKCQNEEASLGMSNRSVVRSAAKLAERVRYIHEKFDTNAIVEEFIEGREVNVGVIGNQRLSTFPAWELIYGNITDASQEVYGSNAKFNDGYREQRGITTARAEVSDLLQKRLSKAAKDAFKSLYLSGYARMDFRLSPNGDIFLLEVNPNPDIAINDEFAVSASADGVDYGSLVNRILQLGLNWSDQYVRCRASL